MSESQLIGMGTSVLVPLFMLPLALFVERSVWFMSEMVSAIGWSLTVAPRPVAAAVLPWLPILLKAEVVG